MEKLGSIFPGIISGIGMMIFIFFGILGYRGPESAFEGGPFVKPVAYAVLPEEEGGGLCRWGKGEMSWVRDHLSLPAVRLFPVAGYGVPPGDIRAKCLDGTFAWTGDPFGRKEEEKAALMKIKEWGNPSKWKEGPQN